MNVPENLKYTNDHEWLLIEDKIVTIGITDYAQGELGDIIFIEFPEIGDTFDKGDVLGTIEAVKTVADIFSPINGEIVEINENLEDNPDLINEEPYNDGWLFKMKIDASDQLGELLDDDQYKKHIV